MGARVSVSRMMVAAAAAAAGALCLSATAAADPKVRQVKTEVRFLEVSGDFLSFSGRLGARFPCLDDRDVTLWYKPAAGAAPQKLGTDETNKKGRFLIELDSTAIAGLYAASVSKDVEREDGDKFLCRATVSAYAHF